MIFRIKASLLNKRFDTRNEKALQIEMFEVFEKAFPGLVLKEHYLSDRDIIDFFFPGTGTGIEVKIKGEKRSIFKQLQRYAAFDDIKEILLITSKAMALPDSINNKPVKYYNISQAWL